RVSRYQRRDEEDPFVDADDVTAPFPVVTTTSLLRSHHDMGRERDVRPGELQPGRNQKTAIWHHSPSGGVELG
ncbi:MAG: hypothetical protein DWI00_14795, partial [Planctomycetota bacterium]